jgi:hypothetical protein
MSIALFPFAQRTIVRRNVMTTCVAVSTSRRIG